MSSIHNKPTLAGPELEALWKKGFLKASGRVARFTHRLKVNADCHFNSVPFRAGDQLLRIDEVVGRTNLDGTFALIGDPICGGPIIVGHFKPDLCEAIAPPKTCSASWMRSRALAAV